MAQIKLKKLEEYLQSVDGFQKPKIQLEQYPTPAHLASCMLYEIQTKFSDIENRIVCDLGSGCGVLSIGAFLLGAQFTIGFEIDTDAVNIFRQNVCEMEIPTVDGVQCDVLHLNNTKWLNAFDTVIMNPPFGTKHNAGIDIKFLEVALKLTNSTVYSLHKTSTRDFIRKKASEWKVNDEVIAELHYNIDASYKFHKKTSVDIEVDCWRFTKDTNIVL